MQTIRRSAWRCITIWMNCTHIIFHSFFIDARYQGRGYGTEAVRLLLQRLKTDGKFEKVVLCYVDGDEAAQRLYEALGFRPTGEVEEDEIVMERML